MINRKHFTKLAAVLLAAFLFVGCTPIDGYHFALTKVDEVKHGRPEIVESVSQDKYAYSTLSLEEKILYDQMYDGIINHRESFKVSAKDPEILDKVYECLTSDYGELFWVFGYSYTMNMAPLDEYVISMSFNPTYTLSKEETQNYRKAIDEVVDEWLGDLTGEESDYEKSKYVYEKLINNVKYNLDAPNNQNIISVFLNKETVCKGYSCAASYMFDKLGIPSVVVTGSSRDESHAWNLIELDGDNYYFDVTWGNSSYTIPESEDKGHYIGYGYLNITTEQLLYDHIIDSSFPLPDCVATDNNYFVREGLYFEGFDAEAIGASIRKCYDEARSSITFKFKSKEDYERAKIYFLTDFHIRDYYPGITEVAYLDNENKCELTLQF